MKVNHHDSARNARLMLCKMNIERFGIVRSSSSAFKLVILIHYENPIELSLYLNIVGLGIPIFSFQLNYWWRYLSFGFSFNKYLTIHSTFFSFKIELLSPHCLFLCCVFHLNWGLWIMKFKIGLKCISTPYWYVAILKQSNPFQVEMDY